MRVIFFALAVLDVLMDKGGLPFHQQVGGQAFLKQLVSMLNNAKMNPEVSNDDIVPLTFIVFRF